jgi:hypothetical protein
MQYWTVTDTATGEVLAPQVATASIDNRPGPDIGIAFDAGTMTAHPIDDAVDPVRSEWNGSGWGASMTALRALKWEAAKARRDAAQVVGCATPAGVVQTDGESRVLINGAVTMALVAQATATPYAITFTLKDNSSVDLDAAAMIALGVAVGTYIGACHDHSLALRAAIDAAPDAAALAAIDVDAGWPAT